MKAEELSRLQTENRMLKIALKSIYNNTQEPFPKTLEVIHWKIHFISGIAAEALGIREDELEDVEKR